MKTITIGKYTLESLTKGMYINPLILYREYIQNAADAIDEAIKENIITHEQSHIEVEIDEDNKRIIIQDNGIGIKKDEAVRMLINIGDSKKRYEKNKGFRGIGRLSGLSYCKKLIFETSYHGETEKTLIEFDGVKLSELLIPGKYENYQIDDVMKEITTIAYQIEEKNKHYFKAILEGVDNKHNLLNEDKVCKYLSEVMPVPYELEKFPFGQEINNELDRIGIEQEQYNLFIRTKRIEKAIYKPYKKKLYVDIKKSLNDEVASLEIKVIRDDAKNKNIALVWYSNTNFMGTILDESVKGLRMRKSGIGVGDRYILNRIFKDSRFNGWVVGEVIVLDDKIIPNARRDDFELTEEYEFLLNELNKIGKEITNKIREASKERNKDKLNKVQKNTDKIETKSGHSKDDTLFVAVDNLIGAIKEHNKYIDKVISVLEQNNIKTELIDSIVEQLKTL